VTSKHELKERIMAGIDDVNRHPVIHRRASSLFNARLCLAGDARRRNKRLVVLQARRGRLIWFKP
jgi:hypothetical protein